MSMLEDGQIDFSITRLEKIASFLNVDIFALLPSQSQILNVNGTQSSGSFYGVHNHGLSPELISMIVDEISKRLKKE